MKHSIKLRKLGYYISSLYRLTRSLRNPASLLLGLAGRPVTLVFKNGIRLRIIEPLELLLAKEVIIDDEYELTTLKEPERIIDAGAGNGDFAIFASKLFPQCSVTAVEASEERWVLLQKNLLMNRCDSVKGVKGEAGTPLMPPSEWLGDEPIDLLKIDCEGAELQILKSIGKKEMSRVRRVSLEHHSQRCEDAVSQLSEFLKESGFSVRVAPNTYTPEIGHIYAEQTGATPLLA